MQTGIIICTLIALYFAFRVYWNSETKVYGKAIVIRDPRGGEKSGNIKEYIINTTLPKHLKKGKIVSIKNIKYRYLWKTKDGSPVLEMVG